MTEFPIITKLGGDAAVYDLLRALSARPKTIAALRMWRTRGRIPGDISRDLMALADEAGIEYCADDFHPATTSHREDVA